MVSIACRPYRPHIARGGDRTADPYNMTAMLAVDFDFFFPEPYGTETLGELWPLYDWAHSEALNAIGDFLWIDRAAGFLRNNLPLPEVQVDPTFWQRFTFNDAAVGWATDSNMHAWNPDLGVDNVWLFDAHHDSGYHPGALSSVVDANRISCEDWMLVYYLTGAELHVRYPVWKTGAFNIEPEPEVPVDRQFDDPAESLPRFDAVHVCRSGAWTPPWGDDKFEAFVAACPVPLVWGPSEGPINRGFDVTAAEHLVAGFAQLEAHQH